MLAAALLTLALTEPASLGALEERGLGFEAQVGQPATSDLTQFLSRDLDELAAEIGRAKQTGYTGDVQTFHHEWLTTPKHRLELIGAVPRIDRRLLRPGTCGEVRLVYRFVLGDARLPMTAAVVYPVEKNPAGCGAAVDELAWPDAPTPKLVLQSLASANSVWNRIATRALRPVRVEVNIQLARWPYTNTSRFSDQVHYLLRTFTWHAGRLTVLPLENTPDVARLRQDQKLRDTLLVWLKLPEQQAALKRGTLQLPAEYLAPKAVSVSPFGLSRLTNRPFSAVFQAGELGKRELRQLDMLSCTGCHQARSVAGFHLLGFERGTQPAWTSLRTPWSAHFAAVQTWRVEDNANLRAGKDAPAPIDPERFGLEGADGAPCGLDATFAEWTCGKDQVCRPDLPNDDRPELGSCHPKRPARSGDACDPATLTSEIDPLADQWVEAPSTRCTDAGVCATSRNGFPAGICARECQRVGGDDAPCVAVPTLGPFTVCLNGGGTFAGCAAKHHALAALPACQSTADCRPDFVCVTGSGRAGACVPPYFLHQLTIEHRPSL